MSPGRPGHEGSCSDHLRAPGASRRTWVTTWSDPSPGPTTKPSSSWNPRSTSTALRRPGSSTLRVVTYAVGATRKPPGRRSSSRSARWASTSACSTPVVGPPTASTSSARSATRSGATPSSRRPANRAASSRGCPTSSGYRSPDRTSTPAETIMSSSPSRTGCEPATAVSSSACTRGASTPRRTTTPGVASSSSAPEAIAIPRARHSPGVSVAGTRWSRTSGRSCHRAWRWRAVAGGVPGSTTTTSTSSARSSTRCRTLSTVRAVGRGSVATTTRETPTRSLPRAGTVRSAAGSWRSPPSRAASRRSSWRTAPGSSARSSGPVICSRPSPPSSISRTSRARPWRQARRTSRGRLTTSRSGCGVSCRRMPCRTKSSAASWRLENTSPRRAA